MIDKILNAWLKLDPESSQKIKRLQGKVVSINLLGVNINCQMIFQDDKVSLRWHDFLPEDLTISGTPLRLLQLKFTKDRKSFFSDDVTLKGDMTLAQDVLSIFDEWHPDLEEFASHWIGDIPAHKSGKLLRNLCKTAHDFKERIFDNFEEYLHEEIAICPPKEELQDFFADIDDLRLQVDRLEAKILTLRGRL